MGIFSFFSKLIKKKTISLPEKCRGDIVYFVPLKNNTIELGTEVKIDHGYCVVIAYHNKVLDILRDDEEHIKLEDVTLPRLFREHQHMLAKKGIATPKRLPADVYFVKCGGHNLNFKTYEKFLCKTPNGKIRMRIAGDFDFCIKDMRKFMSVFCSEFAIVRNKFLEKDISIVVADEVSKILDKAELSFDIYTTCKDKVQSLLLSKLSKLCVKLGIEISAIRIGELFVPKREKKLHDLAIQRGKQDEFLSGVEQELNKAQKLSEEAFVTASNGEIVLNNVDAFGEYGKANTDHAALANKNGWSDGEGFAGKLSAGASSENSFTQSNVMNERNSYMHEGSRDDGNVYFSPFGQNFGEKNLFDHGNVQKEPELFEAERETAQIVESPAAEHEKAFEKCKKASKDDFVNEIEVAQDAHKGKPMKKCLKCGCEVAVGVNFCPKCGAQVCGLIVCACCGAKNVAGSVQCMVCKSKL